MNSNMKKILIRLTACFLAVLLVTGILLHVSADRVLEATALPEETEQVERDTELSEEEPSVETVELNLPSQEGSPAEESVPEESSSEEAAPEESSPEESVPENAGPESEPEESSSEESTDVSSQEETPEGGEKEPESEPAGGEKAEPEEEKYDDPAGIAKSSYYISAPSGDADANAVYYLTDQLVIFRDISQIRKTSAFDIYGATAYVFRPTENGYYILPAGSRPEKYLVASGGKTGKDFTFTENKDEASVFTVKRAGDGWNIGTGNKYFNIQGKNTGAGFQAAGADVVYLTDTASVPFPADPYGLNGMEYAILYKKAGTTGKPVALESTGKSSGLAGKQVDAEMVDGTMRLADGAEAEFWHFEAAGTGRYYISSSSGQYLVLSGSSFSLTNSRSGASAIIVTPAAASSRFAGKYRFSVLDPAQPTTTAVKWRNDAFLPENNNSEVTNSGEWFDLALPRSIPVRYVYEAADDGGVSRDLPKSVTVYVPFENPAAALAEPASKNYTSETADKRYTYAFEGWSIGGNQFKPGEEVRFDAYFSGSPVVVKAVYGSPEVTDRPVNVRYTVKAGTIRSTHEINVPSVRGDAEAEIPGSEAGSYALSDLTSRYY